MAPRGDGKKGKGSGKPDQLRPKSKQFKKHSRKEEAAGEGEQQERPAAPDSAAVLAAAAADDGDFPRGAHSL